MCSEFNKNRTRLIRLIFNMESFTRNDLIATFREINGGSIAIDGQQTIGAYLSDLAERGVLSEDFGKYSVNKSFAID